MPNEQTTEMDAKAQIAAAELEEKIDTMTGPEVLAWFAKNYMSAGHKRLGRAMVDLHKKKTKG